MKHLLIIALAIALQTGAALAHAGLESQSPAKDATVASPEAISLTFSETVTLEFSGLTVKAADGSEIAIGEAALNPDGGTVLTVPLTVPLQPGVYTVEWHALSVDGHKVHGDYSFTVQ